MVSGYGYSIRAAELNVLVLYKQLQSGTNLRNAVGFFSRTTGYVPHCLSGNDSRYYNNGCSVTVDHHYRRLLASVE